MTKNVAKMWKDYAASIGVGVNNLTQAQKIEAEVAGLRQESIYQTGDAAKMTGTYAGQIASLGAAFTSLKVAVGNVFMPILQKIIPVITQVINWLTALATRAAQVIAILFGVKVSAGGMDAMAASTNAAADAQDNLAGSTKKAGKAAKGALAPFDELNVLAQDTDSGDGGAGGGIGGIGDAGLGELEEKTGVFDEIDEKIRRIAEGIRNFFAPFGTPLERLWNAFKRILKVIGDAGKSLWEDLKPVLEWLIENALLPFLDLLATMYERIVTWAEDHPGAMKGLLAALLLIGLAVLLIVSPVAQVIAIMAVLVIIIGLIAKVFPKVKEAGLAVWAWMKQAWEDIKTWASNALTSIGEFFTGLWTSISTGVSNAWAWIVGVWEGVVAWFVETVIDPLVAFFTPMFQLIGILANNAWVVIKFIWEKVKAWFDEKVITPVRDAFSLFWEAIRNLATAAWDKIVEIWTVVSGWFDEHVITPVRNFFTSLWDNVSTTASDTWDAIKDVWTAVATWWKTNVTQPLTDAWTNFTEWIGEKWESVWDAVGAYLKGVLNGVIDVLNDVLGAVFGGINDVINGVNSLGKRVSGWIDIPTFKVPQIPRLATGAVIPANAPFAAILGDQRSGRNIEAPEGLIRQIMQEELAGMEGGQEVTIKFGGTMGALIRAMKPYIDQENTRVGRSMVRGGIS